MKFSIVVSILNRAHLFKYAMEAIARQEYEAADLEICIGDYASTDNLLSLIDRYSEEFTFKYCHLNPRGTSVPMWSYNPAADFNTLIKNVASHPYIIKLDPEVVIRDEWVIAEMAENLSRDDSRMYNARTHFTEGDNWYEDYDDVLLNYERHYHYAEGGPFSRSKFYFCAGFAKDRFIELGGVEELFLLGQGYEDTQFREAWRNRYGEYEKEISGQAIHLWHPPSNNPPAWEAFNQRLYERFKHVDKNNTVRLGKNNKLLGTDDLQQWGLPNMLSKVYTIKEGQILGVEDPSGYGKELNLLF